MPLDAREERRLEVLDDLHVVRVRDLLRRDVLVQVLQVEVELRADDRAARHGRDDLDLAQEPALGHAGENAHVEEGGTEPAAGEGEAELRPAGRRRGAATSGAFAAFTLALDPSTVGRAGVKPPRGADIGTKPRAKPSRRR